MWLHKILRLSSMNNARNSKTTKITNGGHMLCFGAAMLGPSNTRQLFLLGAADLFASHAEDIKKAGVGGEVVHSLAP